MVVYLILNRQGTGAELPLEIQEMEDGLGVPLTQRTTGGKHGGGTHLTAAARVYIGHFHAYIAGLKDLADQQFREAFGEG